MLYFHANQFIFICKVHQYTFTVLPWGRTIYLLSVIIWKEFDHFDIFQKITQAHYIAGIILTGYGEHQVANIPDAFIHKHARG